LSNWWQKRAQKSPTRRTPRLGLENLESREVMSGGLLPGYYLGSDNHVYRNTPTGPQLVYSGTQSVVAMVATGNGGVDTLFSGSRSRVYFSPDGKNIGGGGNTIYAYNGTQLVEQMVSAGGGVDTLFSGSSSRVYFSPDGTH